MDLRALTIDRFCDYVWWYVTRDAASSDIEKFKARLWRPPVGTIVIDSRSPWSAENETSAIRALKKQLGLDKKPR